MKRIQTISDSEYELMKLIWNRGGTAWYSQIMEDLAQGGSTWQKNTVITLLSRLTEKGLLKPNKVGRRNEYVSVYTEADYQASQTRGLLDKLYQGSAKGLVSTLIQQEMLTPEEYEELKTFWEGAKG